MEKYHMKMSYVTWMESHDEYGKVVHKLYSSYK